jgi:transcriptional regulator with XRE-family HTH domain
MTDDLRTPGQKLKAAREALGKTTSELAKITRITTQQLEGLEADDYDRIPAPMYVRGFMKLYAHELGLDPEPLLEGYEAIRTGEFPNKKGAVHVRKPEPVAPVPSAVIEEDEALVEDIQTPGLRPQQRAIFAREDPMAKPKRFSFSKPSIPALPAIPLPNFREMDWKRYVSGEWLRTSWIPRIAGGVFVMLLLLMSLRGCGPQDAPAPEASNLSEYPALTEPLLSEPGPVYFDLPRTLE